MKLELQLATRAIGALAVGIFLGVGGCPSSKKYQTYRRPEIDMPVSLAAGTVRTPEFHVTHENYVIMIELEKKLPFADMMCMLGLTTGPLSSFNCDKQPLLQADWTLLDGGRVVAEGSVHERNGNADYLNRYIFRHLGRFVGEDSKTYTLEVKFTKDGTPLNVTDPHLIVVMVKASDYDVP